MQHITSLALAQPDQPTSLTIGGFDGVHRGHQTVVKMLVKNAGATGLRSAALTFFPLPKQVVDSPTPHYYLTTPKERARLLGELGIDLVITHPFTDQVRAIRAADFVQQLVSQLAVREIWVGADFALGYRREGDVEFLREIGRSEGFTVRQVDFLTVDGMTVSSSLIREAVSQGRVEDAAKMLGRPFRLIGRVVAGDARGRTIGFPTANLEIWDELACPMRGVYAAMANVGRTSIPAAVNVGVRPTVSSQAQTIIEAHLLDFSGELCGQEMSLDFFARLRDEIKFDRVEHLVAQIQIDIARVRAILPSRREPS